MDEKTVQLIMKLSDAFGAPGFEDDVIKAAAGYAKDFISEIRKDAMNNLYLNRGGLPAQAPVVMLDAHSDEVGFMIQAIHDNGTLDFLPLGGWGAATLSGSLVRIRTREGKLISGIIASKPVHFMTEEDRRALPSPDKMVIDVGAVSKEEAMTVYGVHVGDPVVPTVTAQRVGTDLILGKAFDDRIGCAVVLETLRRLTDEELYVNLIGTLTSQEEVGERGAEAAAAAISPALALVIEGAPADDTFTPEYKIQTGLRRGPMIRHMDTSMIANPRLVRFVQETAAELGIPLQESVRKGGGTNAGVIHKLPAGVPSIVISVPVRYAHSSYCYMSLQDFEQTVTLVCELLKKLTNALIQSF